MSMPMNMLCWLSPMLTVDLGIHVPGNHRPGNAGVDTAARSSSASGTSNTEHCNEERDEKPVEVVGGKEKRWRLSVSANAVVFSSAKIFRRRT